MHWHYGKRIIKLAEYVARSDNLFAVYLTCFRCSPDSFLASYVKDIMTHYNKPFLILQLDEHSSDVGYTTRVEAGIRTFKNYNEKKKKARAHIKTTEARNDLPEKGDTVLIPYLDQLISRFWVNCFQKAGFNSLLLDAEEKSLNTGYQFVNGGECMPLVSIAGSAVDKIINEKLAPENTFLYIPTTCLACNFPQFPILSDLVFKSAGLNGVKIGLINSMEPGKILPRTLAIKMFESYIAGCIIYKMYNRIKPYEVNKGETEKAFQKTLELMNGAILTGQDLRKTLSESASLFRKIKQDMSGGRKPRIALIGDLYVKYNEVMNQKIQSLVEELGGELVTPSMTEYPFHFYDADIRLFGEDPRHYNLLRSIERRFERVAADIIEDQLEPDFAECVDYMEDYKIKHYITGETSINIGRALYYVKHGTVDAILHINPMFCCPGVVTSSVYRKIQEDFNIPIIDIFYDGTGNPNSIMIPHMHYLHQKK
jgi:predicted nucleotide-binding protein (sugar kinase/HSP70/actin superfamily)